MSFGRSGDPLVKNVSTINSNLASNLDYNVYNADNVSEDNDVDMLVLDNLRSEAGLPRTHPNKNSQTGTVANKVQESKRQNTELIQESPKIKVFGSDSDPRSPLDSANNSTSGSVITISDDILRNRYSEHNQGPYDIDV
ncbi:unnamed protein product [Lasius platythorax]|uniref:Uncharacterized protein n=1 Tax=Lasius platythorax TaxID=488582 RepID=A0AAV2NNJ4_9HYME